MFYLYILYILMNVLDFFVTHCQLCLLMYCYLGREGYRVKEKKTSVMFFKE